MTNKKAMERVLKLAESGAQVAEDEGVQSDVEGMNNYEAIYQLQDYVQASGPFILPEMDDPADGAEFDAFKYVTPDAPTKSGLYWPQMRQHIWSYCYYLGSWAGFGRGRYDLGVKPARSRVNPRGVSDATVSGPDSWDSGELIVSTYRLFGGAAHYQEVLVRALKHGFKVRAWPEGPLVQQRRAN
tara:strand:+ start:3201 stop:3755 length:555 start_codon:yes stop_codon:yes gene_type:complete